MQTPKFPPGDFYAHYDEKLQAYKLYRILIAEPAYNGIVVKSILIIYRTPKFR